LTLRVEWYAAGQTDLERINVQRLDRAAPSWPLVAMITAVARATIMPVR
jgi:hypothetical protein